MSFTDLMTSARGPGLIGMIFALIVLLGFGFLFTLSMKEELPGGMTLEQYAREQAKEIASYKARILSEQAMLSGADGREEGARALKKLASSNVYLQGQIDGLNNDIAAARKSIAETTDGFAKYKDEYRDFARKKAKGMRVPKITLKTGEELLNVTVREVTPVGMQVRHDGGHKRIPFEQLPDDMQDHFQFDAAQKGAALASEAALTKVHENEVAAVKEAEKMRTAAAHEREAIEKKQQARRDAADCSARAKNLEEEIRAIERQLPYERDKKISRAPQLERSLSNKRSELANLRIRISTLQTQF